MAKKRSKKEPRNRYITIDFGKPTKLNAISYSPATDEIRLFNDGDRQIPESAIIEQSYKREKGPKVLVRSNLPNDGITTNPNRALEQYAEIYAIDTNTKIVDGERISVCGVVGGSPIQWPMHTAIRYRPIHCMEYRGIVEHPEKVGWTETIEAIMRSPSFSNSKKYAVVVDAYLGDLAPFNSRSKPLLDGFYLPPAFTLIYASSDSHNESLANQMLSMADKIASGILKLLEKNRCDPSESISGKPYTSRRLWKPKN